MAGWHDVDWMPALAWRVGAVVIEAGAVAEYIIAWAVRKARRVGDQLDTKADRVIDASLNRLHEVVMARLGSHPVLADVLAEAEAGGGDGEVSVRTRQQMELAVKTAAEEDDIFGRAVTELVVRLREAERAAGSPVIAGTGSAVFTGNAQARAENGGTAFGQVAGVVLILQALPFPSWPGRASL